MATDVCIFCLDAKNNPVGVACGHTFCRECLKGYVRIGQGTHCPLCRRPLDYAPPFNADTDSLFELLIAVANETDERNTIVEISDDDDDYGDNDDVGIGEDYELDDDYLIDMEIVVDENQNDDDDDVSFDDLSIWPDLELGTSDSESENSESNSMSLGGSTSSDEGSLSLDDGSYWDDYSMENDIDDLLQEDGNPRNLESDGDNDNDDIADDSDQSDDSHDNFLDDIFTFIGELD